MPSQKDVFNGLAQITKALSNGHGLALLERLATCRACECEPFGEAAGFL